MKGHIRERSPGHWAIVIDAQDAAGKRTVTGGGVYAIRALRDLCLGIGSERLGVLEHFSSRL
jgi:hypothetical protein